MLKEIVKDDNIMSIIEEKLTNINEREKEHGKEEEEKVEESNKKQHQAPRKHKERNEIRNEATENEKKKPKTISHPIIELDKSGDVKTKIEWYERYKKKQKKDLEDDDDNE